MKTRNAFTMMRPRNWHLAIPSFVAGGIALLLAIPFPAQEIFLHGNCASIGCIPITDDGIKEVYWLAVLVHNQNDQHLPIEIFPARLTDDGLKALTATHPNQPAMIKFWSNLKEGYDYFEKEHRLPRIKTRADGAYAFTSM